VIFHRANNNKFPPLLAERLGDDLARGSDERAATDNRRSFIFNVSEIGAR
jgi:hypothetical protein